MSARAALLFFGNSGNCTNGSLSRTYWICWCKPVVLWMVANFTKELIMFEI